MKALSIVLFCVFAASCQSRVTNTKNDTIDTLAEIIDPVEIIPFEVHGRELSIELPDSIGGKGSTGFAVLNLFINKKAVVDSFKIVKLLLNRNGIDIIDYYLNKSPDENVKQFYPLLTEYIKKEVEIKRTPGVNVDSITSMVFMVKFK